MLEVRGPILEPLLLVLRASLNSAPDGIQERTGIFDILSKESLEIHPRQGGHSFALDSALVLVPTNADPTTKERGCKGCAIATLGAGGVEVILTLLTKVVTLLMKLPKVEVGEPGGLPASLRLPCRSSRFSADPPQYTEKGL